MELPQEIELWYVIPTIRKALVIELKNLNLKQKDIAILLDVTEPAISQYIKDKRASCCYDAFEKDPLKSEIKKSALIIKNQEKPDPTVAFKEINRLTKIIRLNKTICEIHRQKNDSLKHCNICYEENKE